MDRARISEQRHRQIDDGLGRRRQIQRLCERGAGAIEKRRPFACAALLFVQDRGGQRRGRCLSDGARDVELVRREAMRRTVINRQRAGAFADDRQRDRGNRPDALGLVSREPFGQHRRGADVVEDERRGRRNRRDRRVVVGGDDSFGESGGDPEVRTDRPPSSFKAPDRKPIRVQNTAGNVENRRENIAIAGRRRYDRGDHPDFGL